MIIGFGGVWRVEKDFIDIGFEADFAIPNYMAFGWADPKANSEVMNWWRCGGGGVYGGKECLLLMIFILLSIVNVL
ncbi:hypothetical protein NC651_017473 [Populus alba x Populus x berolinensis]|nr:hypothetical protein NC651_017473 [Populus alba x Populus x berolinensis]